MRFRPPVTSPLTLGIDSPRLQENAANATAADADSVKAAVDGAVDGIVDDVANEAAPRTRALINDKNLELEAASEGTWGNRLRMRIDHDVSADVAHRLGLASADLFNLTVRDMGTGVTESFLNLSHKESPRLIADVLASSSTLVRVAKAPTQKPGAHAAVADPDPFTSVVTDAYSEVKEAASDGSRLKDTDYIGSPAEKTGLNAPGRNRPI